MGLKDWWDEKRNGYPLIALVLEPRANSSNETHISIVPRLTKARRKMNKEGDCVYILQDDTANPQAARHYKNLYGMANGTNLLMLYNPDFGDYFSARFGDIQLIKHVISGTDENGKEVISERREAVVNIDVMDEDVKSWIILSIKQNELRYAYKTNWEAAIPIISLFIALVALGVFWKITSGDAQKLAETLKSIGDAVAQSAKNLQSCSGGVIPPAPPG